MNEKQHVLANIVAAGTMVIVACAIVGAIFGRREVQTQTPGSWTLMSIQAQASRDLPRRLSEKAMDLALQFGEPHPRVVQFRTGETDRGHEPMYRITLAGRFIDGALASSYMNYSILTNGTEIWAVTGTDTPDNVIIWREDKVILP